MAPKALFVFLSILSLTNLIPTTSAIGFSVELIHRDHTKSPLYNPTLSHADRVREAVHRSNIRAKTLTKSFFSKQSDNDYNPLAPSPSDTPYPPPSDSPSYPPPADSPSYPPPADGPSSPNGNIQSEIIKNSFNYLMSINVGTPKKEIISIADTGSDLIWATCEPCTDCYKQDAPRFDPSASFSYSDLPCTSKQCSQLPRSQCGKSSACTYLYEYGDGSQTRGNLAQETLTFDTTSHATVKFPKVSFGCSHQANGTFDPKSAGLVGLAAGPLSLISQLGAAINHRFSYCLVSFNQANVTTSKLSFGSDATVSGPDVAVTNMVDDSDGSSFYTVTLDGITVGDNNTLGAFENPYYMIVDSGTTLTYLDQSVLDSLVQTLSSTISLPQVQDDEGLFALCFDDSNAGSDFVYPDITLKLGKATVVLKPYNSFVKKDANVTCLAMTAFKGDLGEKSLSILGNIAQQNFHVGYDLGMRKVSFALADCTKY